MVRILEELEPGNFVNQSFSVASTPEQALYGQYRGAFRREIGSLLVEPDFSAAEVPTRLEAILDEVTPGIIAATHKSEGVWTHPSYQPLRQFLGTLAVSETELDDLRPNPDFVEGLRIELRDLPHDFSELEVYHRIFSTTKYLALAKEIATLAKEQPASWADQAYAQVSEAVDNPKDYSLPVEKNEALYLIPFLSGYERQLSRRLIVNNIIFDSLLSKLGPEITEDESTILTALRTALNANVLTGQQWTQLAVSEDTQKKIALKTTENLDALGTIQQLIQARRGLRVAETWEQVADELDEKIKETCNSSPINYWESEDIGHCFQGFRAYDLLAAFQKGMYEKWGPEMNPTKDGSKAVILEDDEEQMRAWKSTIERHTPQAVDSDLCFYTPEHVLEAADDTNVRLFLLDIQNGTDTTAGIKLGEAILDKRLKALEEEPDLPLTKIVVWTASKQLCSLANDYFKPKLEKYARGKVPLCYLLTGTGSSRGDARLHFEVTLKGVDIGDVERKRS